MRFLICTADIDPCPVGNVSSLSISDVLDFPGMGITPEAVLLVFSWGFSAVLMGFFLGYGVSLAVGLIRKL
jgi:hypothetical protein